MKKSILVKLAIVLLATSTLSGCFWRAEEEGNSRGDYHERDHADYHGEHHEDNGDNN
jgi:uncharacterized lipoprotein